MSYKYSRYIHRSNIVVFITISAIKRAKLISLAPQLVVLAYLIMLFIYQLMHTAELYIE